VDNKCNGQTELRTAFDQLHFSEEAKEIMAKDLLEQMETAQHETTTRRTRRPVLRLATVGIAAAALTICAGAVALYNQLASESFAGVFGTAHTEIVDQIGRPVGASDTDNGVTITADAIIGDKYHYAATFTIAKDDGTPFDIDFDTDKNGTLLLPLNFASADIDLGILGGMHGTSYFYDAEPSDNAIQYVVMWEADQEIVGRTAKATFEDVIYTDLTGDTPATVTVAEGKWTMRFEMNFEDTSVNLPAGQIFERNGIGFTIDKITLSPVALRVDYTADSEVVWDKDREKSGQASDAEDNEVEAGRQSVWDSEQVRKFLEDIPLIIHKKDGTTLDLSHSGGSIQPKNGTTVCQKGNMFEEVLPVEDVISVTVGDIDIPVNA